MTKKFNHRNILVSETGNPSAKIICWWWSQILFMEYFFKDCYLIWIYWNCRYISSIFFVRVLGCNKIMILFLTKGCEDKDWLWNHDLTYRYFLRTTSYNETNNLSSFLFLIRSWVTSIIESQYCLFFSNLCNHRLLTDQHYFNCLPFHHHHHHHPDK